MTKAPLGALAPLCWFERVEAILKDGRSRLLVFGLGHDTSFYTKLNSKGVNVFIEDDYSWVTKSAHIPNAKILHYQYSTKLIDWEKYITVPPPLIDLPIWHTVWDLILIDGPCGYYDAAPGRIQSIHTTSTLSWKRVMLDDFNRPCEKEISCRYLGQPKEVYGPSGRIAEWGLGQSVA